MTSTNQADSTDSSSQHKLPDETLQEMLRESRQRQAEIAALLKGSRAVLQIREFPDAARAMFDSCKSLVGATSGYIALLSDDGTENEVLFLDSGGLPCTVDPSLPMPVRGLREKACQSGKVVFDNAFSQGPWTKFLPEGHSTLDNVLFAPLMIRGEVVGLLGIANKPGGFTDRDARMAAAFGELAAIALQNSRTLEALESSERRVRALTQSANDGIVSTDWAGKIIYWNNAAEEMFGHPAGEIVGKPLTSVIPERFREAHLRGIRRVISTGESRTIGKTVELVGLRADGAEFPIELSLSTWKSGEGTFFTGILRDITEQKQARQRNDTVIRTSMDGFWAIDLEGNILEVNDAYCRLVGYSRDELLSMNVRDLEIVESPEEIRAHASKARETGSDRFESRHRGKHGSVVDLDISANYLPIEGGRICAFLRDDTQRKEAVAALWASQRELATRNRIAQIFLTVPDEGIYAETLSVLLEVLQSKYGYFGYIDEEDNLVCPSMTQSIWQQCRVEEKGIVFPRDKWGGLWGESLIKKKTLSSNGPLHVPKGHIPLKRALVAPIIHNGRPIGQFAVADKDSDYNEQDKELLDAVANHVAPVLHARLQTDRLTKHQKQAEEKAKFLAAFPAENPDPVMRARHDGTLIYANEASRRLLDLWDRDVGQILPEPVSTTVSSVFASQRRADIEIECQKRTIVIRLVPVVDAGYVNLYGRDITERKQTRLFLEIANRHVELGPLLEEFVAEVKSFTDCTAVGIRVLQDDGGIPYQTYYGFPRSFYELESPLSIGSDKCMCINVVKGETDPKLPFYTEGGSFWMNGTTQFLATISEQEKGDTRNVCNEFGYESVALVPMRLGNRILGLIHVADPCKNAIPRDVVESLERIGMQLGTAIQRVRAEEAVRAANEELETRVQQRTAELQKANRELKTEISERQRLEREVLDISTQEQRRIGQELHDRLGQELTGLGYLAKSLHQGLRNKELPEAETAGDLAQGIPLALGQVQTIVKGLVPLEIGLEDLAIPLQALTANVEERTGISCRFLGNQPVQIADGNTAVQLYRIAQEAVTNAVKHADAQHIVVTLTDRRGQIRLEVRDDGKGVGPGAETASGSGLRIMRYRARAIGGSLDIQPRAGGGTLVACVLPGRQRSEQLRQSPAT